MFSRRATLRLLAAAPAAIALTPRAALAREPAVFQNPIAINAIDPIGHDRAIQGNLDPMLMVTGGEALAETARGMVETMRGRPYILNLGHGITPEADPENVAALLEAVRG